MVERSTDLICMCMYVNRGTIEKAIRERNLSTVEEVGEVTEAGTNCGACQVDIDIILSNHKPIDKIKY